MNPEVDAQVGKLKLKAQVLSLAVNRAVVLVSDRTPNLAAGLQLAVRFAFTLHQFPAVLTVLAVHDDAQDGYKKLACEMDFLPELVEVMDSYYRRRRR
jgi:hypothetical protein